VSQNVLPPPRPEHLPPWLIEPEEEPRRPRVVGVSTVLWLASIAVGAAGIGLMLVDLDNVRANLLADVARQLPTELPSTWERVTAAALAVITGGGAVILLLQLGFALAMRNGHRWARIALIPTGLAGLGHALIAAGALPRPALAGIPAALAVAGAITMFLPASNVWFNGWGGRR